MSSALLSCFLDTTFVIFRDPIQFFVLNLWIHLGDALKSIRPTSLAILKEEKNINKYEKNVGFLSLNSIFYI